MPPLVNRKEIMSALFGWSYPPGCSGSPYDGDEVIDLAPALLKLKSDLVGYWDENGKLFAGTQYSEEGRLPEVGTLDWDDDLSEEQNIARAAKQIHVGTRLDLRRWNRLEKKLRAFKPKPVEVPTFEEFCAELGFPEGDFKWDDPEVGGPHVYCCGNPGCSQQWHKMCYADEFGRRDGKLYINVRSCDEDGNWDFDDGFE